MKPYYEHAHVYAKVKGFPTDDLDIQGVKWWAAQSKHGVRFSSVAKRRRRTDLNKRARTVLKRQLRRGDC